jgi:hypothetical protein
MQVSSEEKSDEKQSNNDFKDNKELKEVKEVKEVKVTNVQHEKPKEIQSNLPSTNSKPVIDVKNTNMFGTVKK